MAVDIGDLDKRYVSAEELAHTRRVFTQELARTADLDKALKAVVLNSQEKTWKTYRAMLNILVVERIRLNEEHRVDSQMIVVAALANRLKRWKKSSIPTKAMVRWLMEFVPGAYK